MMVFADIFDSPSSRSINRIGTSQDAGPGLGGPVGHLDLEAVSVGPDAGQVDRSQDLGPVDTEAGRHIADGQSEHQRRVAIAGPGQHAPVRPPTRYGPAGDVTRADHQIVVHQPGQQPDQAGGIVRQIRVHLHHGIEASGQAPAEAGAVGVAEAESPLPTEDVHSAELLANLLRQDRRSRPGCRRRRPGSPRRPRLAASRRMTSSMVAASL